LAEVLEKDPDVVKWIRPPDGNVPMMYKGKYYTPDFIVQTSQTKCLIEVKARGELEPTIDSEVKDKAVAAIRWCQIALTIKEAIKWKYKLIPDDVIKRGYDFKFIIGNAFKLIVQ